MSKVADVRLFWTKSPSLDIAETTIIVTINGVEAAPQVLSASIESYDVVIPAASSAAFKIVSTDAEGNFVESETYTFGIGDLEPPFPATNLGHEIVAIRDVP